MDDENVVSVYATNQNTRKIPTILCETFENLATLYFTSSRVRIIDEMTFANCRNLQSLIMNSNQLTAIPDDTFQSNINLEIVQIMWNDLKEISPRAFSGSSIRQLDLTNNKLNSIDSIAFEPINATLTDLFLPINAISNLTENDFLNLRNLEVLQLNANPIRDFPPFTLSPLINLKTLTLFNCRLTELNPHWFSSLANLNALHLSLNSIESLPIYVFNQLRSIEVINVADNQLSTLSLLSFGESANSMKSLYASNNRINAIDREIIFGSGRTVDLLMLSLNLCTNRDFFSVRNDMNGTYEALSECFRNFDDGNEKEIV
jgi:Leucine-rich repeat (LRR) protein